MSKKLSNDENIKNLNRRKVLRVVVIICAIITISLSILSIFDKVNIIFPIIFFILTHFLLKYREKIEINKTDDLADVRSLLNKIKKR